MENQELSKFEIANMDLFYGDFKALKQVNLKMYFGH